MFKPEPTHRHKTDKNLRICFSKFDDTVFVWTRNKPVIELDIQSFKNEDDFGPERYTGFYLDTKFYDTSDFEKL